MNKGRQHRSVRQSAEYKKIVLVFASVILFFVFTNIWAGCERGKRFRSLDGLKQFESRKGFVFVGQIGQFYDARIVDVRNANEQIAFTVNGQLHTYEGFIGYQLKVVLLKDNRGQEFAVVFRSKEQTSRTDEI